MRCTAWMAELLATELLLRLTEFTWPMQIARARSGGCAIHGRESIVFKTVEVAHCDLLFSSKSAFVVLEVALLSLLSCIIYGLVSFVTWHKESQIVNKRYILLHTHTHTHTHTHMRTCTRTRTHTRTHTHTHTHTHTQGVPLISNSTQHCHFALLVP